MSSGPACSNLDLYSPLAHMTMWSLDFLECDHYSIFLVLQAWGYRGEIEPVQQAIWNKFRGFKEKLAPYRVSRLDQRNEVVFECEKLPEARAPRAKYVMVENTRMRMVKIISTPGKLWCRFADLPGQ